MGSTIVDLVVDLGAEALVGSAVESSYLPASECECCALGLDDGVEAGMKLSKQIL